MAYKTSLCISSFDYDLPDDKIAKYPLPERDASKLLYYNNGNIAERNFTDLPNLLSKGDLLVFNNTKVIRARLRFAKSTGAQIEVLCLHPHSPSEYELMFANHGKCQWECMVGNLKKWKNDEALSMILPSGGILEAKCIERRQTDQIVEFSWPDDYSFAEVIDQLGQTPIPPYLNRNTEPIDEQRYQTIYSKWKGSVAAPTAGLHFTERVLSDIRSHGIDSTNVTLHVGAGTFQPVKSEKVAEHNMHTEFFTVSIDSLIQLRDHIGKTVSVGTTSLRTIESIYWLGVKTICSGKLPDNPFVSQWDPYEYQGKSISQADSVSALINALKANNQTFINASTQILCMPGYIYKMTDKLVTNFHQPKSTLLLLIAAFVGEDWKSIYKFALEHDFRFLSYGDSNLLIKNQ